MKEIKKGSTTQDVETILITWLGSISGGNKNLIILDKNIFSQTASPQSIQALINLFNFLDIQHISLKTADYQQEIIGQIEQQTKVKIDIEQRSGIQKSTWISLGGLGFQIDSPLQEVLQGANHAILEYLNQEKLLEVLFEQLA